MNTKWRSLVLFLLMLTGMSAHAQFEQCRDQFPNGAIPKAPHAGRALCFDSFAVFYSPEFKRPIYTVERLNRERLEQAREPRTNQFYEEARLPFSERAHLSDYAHSGYDRGHNAPAGDMPNMNAMAQSFSLANMMPQAPENNRGIWAKAVEKPTRKYVLKRAVGDVFVYTGSVGNAGCIGSGCVMVPTHIFKLVYDIQAHKAWGYWVENTNEARMSKPVSYEQIEQLTGIRFGF